MSIVNTVGIVALFGANYKIMRDVAKPDLMSTARLYFSCSLIAISILGTTLTMTVGAPPLIFFASGLLVLSHLLFAMLVRLGQKNSVLKAQISSAVVLLVAALLLTLLDSLTESTFIVITSTSFSVGFIWQLRRHWEPQESLRYESALKQCFRLLRSGISLQILYVPTLLVTALLPALASLVFSTEEVSAIAAVMSYGTAFQVLGSFLIYSVFVPNVTRLRENGAERIDLRKELRRQNVSMGFLSLGFLVIAGLIGDDLLPTLMGDSYAATGGVVVAVSGLYVLQALIFSQTAFGLLVWPTRLFMFYQIGALLMMGCGVVLALINAGSQIEFLAVIASGYALCLVAGIAINSLGPHDRVVRYG
jgi:hypothetical protein